MTFRKPLYKPRCRESLCHHAPSSINQHQPAHYLHSTACQCTSSTARRIVDHFPLSSAKRLPDVNGLSRRVTFVQTQQNYQSNLRPTQPPYQHNSIQTIHYSSSPTVVQPRIGVRSVSKDSCFTSGLSFRCGSGENSNRQALYLPRENRQPSSHRMIHPSPRHISLTSFPLSHFPHQPTPTHHNFDLTTSNTVSNLFRLSSATDKQNITVDPLNKSLDRSTTS